MSLTIRKIWREQEGKFFCISTKVPNKDGTWRDHFFRRDQFDDIPDFLKENSHLEIYFSPHGYNRRSRTVEESIAPKLMWADLDEVNPSLIPDKLKPTVAIQSSEGRFVGLWKLSDKEVTLELNRRLNKHICPESHSSWIFTKALRMPGTYNRKYKTPQKVTLLWDNGPKYTFAQMDQLLPKLDQPSVSGSNAREVFNKYRKALSADLQREIFKGNPKPGLRSDMIWKIIKSFAEAGATEDEIYEVVHVSPWNKFKGLRKEETSIRRQIAKAFEEKLTGYDNKKPKHKQSEKEQLEDDDSFDADEGRKKLNLQRIDQVKEENVDWVWAGRLPVGELVILEGDPGVGKSFFAQWLAAQVCDGKRLPTEGATGRKPTQGKVLYFDLENDAARVTKKRLAAAKLEHMENFYQVATPLSMDDEEDTELMYEALNQVRPTLVFFDTINNYIGKADLHNAKEATQALTPFSQIARKFNCTVVVLRHLTKNSLNTTALYRGQGSIAQSGVARVVLSAGKIKDPDGELDGMIGIAVTKNNLSWTGQTLVFKIEYDPSARGGYDDKAHVSVHGFIDKTADELLAAPTDQKTKKKDEMSDGEATKNAEAFLLEKLNQGQRVKFSKLLDQGEKRSLSHKDLAAAAKNLGVLKSKGEWYLDN